MDALDEELIRLLRENARASTAELARRLGISRTTVQSRIERLERRRVILGYTVKADGGEAIKAHVMIATAPKVAPAVEAALRKIPEVRTLHSVSGVYDLIAIVAARSVGEMDAAIDRIGQLQGVDRTTSSIVLSTRIER